MTRLEPPTLANALLHRLALDNEPLAGDLVEEFQRRQSRLWLWRQLIVALAMQALYAPHPPVSLNLTPVDPVVAEWLMSKKLDKKKAVNLTGTGVEGIGGLTMVILGFMMATVISRDLVVRVRRNPRRLRTRCRQVEVTEFCPSQHGGTKARSLAAVTWRRTATIC